MSKSQISWVLKACKDITLNCSPYFLGVWIEFGLDQPRLRRNYIKILNANVNSYENVKLLERRTKCPFLTTPILFLSC